MGRSKLTFDLLMQLWPLGKLESWASKQPVLGKVIHGDFGTERNRHIIIPTNEVISGSQSVVLPSIVLEELIGRASHHVVLNECLCRRSEHCQTYPTGVGCLFLGEAAGQINPALGRMLSPPEAGAYARQAIKLGLTPMIVHSAFDAELLKIDFRRMLAVCFCCDCCCTVRRNLRSGPSRFADTILRFPGLHVEVGEACNGCGECLDLCHAHALNLAEGRAVISEACKGCGRCALACPEQAITLRVEEESTALQRLFALVEERTEIS